MSLTRVVLAAVGVADVSGWQSGIPVLYCVVGQCKSLQRNWKFGNKQTNEYTLPEEYRKDFPDLKISPNHHKAAKQFAFSDNYYCDSDASVHGHHWLVGVIPNEWVESNASTSKTAMPFSKAEGRRFPKTIGSVDPEDYAEIGGLWEALERENVEFYNFGQANESGHEREDWYDTNTGAAHGVMIPMQRALFKRTSHNYAGYNMNIPDQYRMDQFESEFTKKWIEGEEEIHSENLPRWIKKNKK